MDKAEVIEKAAHEILNGEMESAKELIQNEYPFKHLTSNERKYTDKQKMEQLNWKLHEPGNYKEWDGLTVLFVKLVKADSFLLEDAHIKNGITCQSEICKKILCGFYR